MTLEEFRASGHFTEDLSNGGENFIHEGPGRIYAGGLVINANLDISTGEYSSWCLTIGNDSHTGPLPQLEDELYQWARAQEIIT
jgi:hypothetical protein